MSYFHSPQQDRYPNYDDNNGNFAGRNRGGGRRNDKPYDRPPPPQQYNDNMRELDHRDNDFPMRYQQFSNSPRYQNDNFMYPPRQPHFHPGPPQTFFNEPNDYEHSEYYQTPPQYHNRYYYDSPPYYPNDFYYNNQYPNQHPSDRYNDRRSNNDERFSNRYPNDERFSNRYPNDERSNNRYPNDERSSNIYPNDTHSPHEETEEERALRLENESLLYYRKTSCKLGSIPKEIDKIFKAAGVLLYSVDNGVVKFLLGCEDRSQKKKNNYNISNEVFLPFGGKIEEGETAIDTAVREFNEETAFIFNDRIEEYRSKMISEDSTKFWIHSSKYLLICVEIPFDQTIPQQFLSADKTTLTNTDQIYLEWIEKDEIFRAHIQNPSFNRPNGQIGECMVFFIQMFSHIRSFFNTIQPPLKPIKNNKNNINNNINNFNNNNKNNFNNNNFNNNFNNNNNNSNNSNNFSSNHGAVKFDTTFPNNDIPLKPITKLVPPPIEPLSSENSNQGKSEVEKKKKKKNKKKKNNNPSPNEPVNQQPQQPETLKVKRKKEKQVARVQQQRIKKKAQKKKMALEKNIIPNPK